MPSKAHIINLMLAALDEMQSYNGQSATSAICRAMEGEETEDDDGCVAWRLPLQPELNRLFRS